MRVCVACRGRLPHRESVGALPSLCCQPLQSVGWRHGVISLLLMYGNNTNIRGLVTLAEHTSFINYWWLLSRALPPAHPSAPRPAPRCPVLPSPSTLHSLYPVLYCTVLHPLMYCTRPCTIWYHVLHCTVHCLYTVLCPDLSPSSLHCARPATQVCGE